MRRRLVALIALAVIVLATFSVAAVTQAKAVQKDKEVEFIGDADGNKKSDDLDKKIKEERDQPNKTFPIIVMLNEPVTDELIAEMVAAAGDFTVKDTWDLALNGFSTDVTAEQADILASFGTVDRVDYDREVQACMNTATLWTGVQQARTNFGVTGSRDSSETSYSTTDVVICVLDTGIYTGHVDLDGGKVIGWKDYINNRATPYDDHGHGSHCSGIAAGTGEGNSAYRGVAPGAALVGVKVLNSAGSGTTTQIVNGVNWMISNRTTYGIKIGSMSLGSTGSSDGTDAISVAVNNASNNGIVMCVAAGNAGPRTYTVGAPGAAANAITVGALYDPGEKGWALAEFSSRGPTADGRTKPEICTPGRNIMSVKANTTNQYVSMSGTSMATPFCAGVCALMLDANYSMSVATVKSTLYASANVKDFGPTGMDIDYGYGISKCYDAIKQAGGWSTTWTDGLDFNYNTGSLSGTGDYDDYYFTVTDASKNIGITLIINSWSTSKDFDIYLYNPSGTQVGSGITATRQDQILYDPSVTGQYRLRVISYSGSGTYFVNTSWK